MDFFFPSIAMVLTCYMVNLSKNILWFPEAIAVSRDHKPDQTDERQRIEDAGGFVMWAGKDLT